MSFNLLNKVNKEYGYLQWCEMFAYLLNVSSGNYCGDLKISWNTCYVLNLKYCINNISLNGIFYPQSYYPHAQSHLNSKFYCLMKLEVPDRKYFTFLLSMWLHNYASYTWEFSFILITQPYRILCKFSDIHPSIHKYVANLLRNY